MKQFIVNTIKFSSSAAVVPKKKNFFSFPFSAIARSSNVHHVFTATAERKKEREKALARVVVFVNCGKSRSTFSFSKLLTKSLRRSVEYWRKKILDTKGRKKTTRHFAPQFGGPRG